MIKIVAKTIPAQPRNKKWLVTGKGGGGRSAIVSSGGGGAIAELTSEAYSDRIYNID